MIQGQAAGRGAGGRVAGGARRTTGGSGDSGACSGTGGGVGSAVERVLQSGFELALQRDQLVQLTV